MSRIIILVFANVIFIVNFIIDFLENFNQIIDIFLKIILRWVGIKQLNK